MCPPPPHHPSQPPPPISTTKNQVASIRQLRADKIGRLSAVAGTVTRTSDVRPELLVSVCVRACVHVCTCAYIYAYPSTLLL